MTPLDRAWVSLILLSAATTVAALSSLASPWSGTLILLVAWAKARLIFLWYLELWDVPNWRAGLLLGLTLFMGLLFGLYIAGTAI